MAVGRDTVQLNHRGDRSGGGGAGDDGGIDILGRGRATAKVGSNPLSHGDVGLCEAGQVSTYDKTRKTKISMDFRKQQRRKQHWRKPRVGWGVGSQRMTNSRRW